MERFAAIALALLVSCGGGGGGRDPDPRPATAPDVVLLSVSGHDGALNALFCTSDTNRAYLGDPGEAVEAIEQAFLDSGLTVWSAHFSDRLEAGGGADELGFEDLLATMEQCYRDWIEGAANPTRIVIVAHSHGATWAHVATSVMSHVPVSYLVSLDGICFLWECEHEAALADWVAEQGSPYSWDISRPCEAWPVAGQAGFFDAKDVAFDNVAVNLEVQSSDLFVSDCCDNYRLDGSLDGIMTFLSPEGHNDVRLASSDAMLWVTDMIRAAEAP